MNPVTHWSVQRATSLALIPLAAWLLWAGASVAGAGYDEAAAFLDRPVNTWAAIATALIALYHAVLGIEVIVEDYLPGEVLPGVLLWATRLGCAAMAVAIAALVLNVAPGG